MKTLLLPADEEGIRLGGRLIAEGSLVGFPTETVYGPPPETTAFNPADMEIEDVYGPPVEDATD